MLKANENINLNRINKIINERDALKNITEENESTKLDEKTNDQLKNEIYKMFRQTKISKEEKANTKKAIQQETMSANMIPILENSSCLGLIEETENILNKFYEDFNFIKEHFPIEYKQCAKDLKTDVRNDFREKNEKLQDQLRKEQADLRQQLKDAKKVKKVGKPLMPRSEALKI